MNSPVPAVSPRFLHLPASIRRLATAVAACLLAVNAFAIDAAEANRRLGRGMNLGNMLEAPPGADWAIPLEAGFFKTIKDAGFQSVRIPIRWSAHAAATTPYTLDETFARRIDGILDQALTNGLAVVLNIHHYEEIFSQPDAHRDRFLGLWRQIATRYRNRPDSVVFELLNEPHDQLTDDRWNELLVDALKVVRATNPERAVMIGPGGWNNAGHLPQLKLPESDSRIVVTFHYYVPFDFTHQGATWTAKPPLVGRRWTGSTAERQALAKDFAAAAEWAKAHRRPLYVGEFGAYEKADLDSRARWTRSVREEAEKHGMSWGYWEFAAGFGAYDRQARQWREPLLRALIPKP